LSIIHKVEQSRFIVVIDNQLSRLEYNLLPRQCIDFTLLGTSQSRRRTALLQYANGHFWPKMLVS